MKKINMTNLNLDLYEETLSNGLKAFYLNIPNTKEYKISLVVKYGSENKDFYLNNELKKPPKGIAHFLEHKVFEMEDKSDPFEFFSKTNTYANAYTFYDKTSYYIEGNKKFDENLKYLLYYVLNPYFTNENVEKEKNIIAQEIKMREDNPEIRNYNNLKKTLYQKSTRKDDLGGEVSDIMQITKEDLFDCYNAFYKAENMFIVITGNFNKEKASKILNETKFINNNQLKIIKEKEPLEVNIKEKTIKDNLEIGRLYMGFKMSKEKISNLETHIIKLYLDVLLSLLFSPSTKFYNNLYLKNEIKYIVSYTQIDGDLITIEINSKAYKVNKIKNKILKYLNNINIKEKDFERIKKVLIVQVIEDSENLKEMAEKILDDYIQYNKVITNEIEIIKNLDYKTMINIINKLDFSNYSILKVVKKENTK